MMEDGEIFKKTKIDEVDIEASDDGTITLIDMSDNTIHFNSEWEKIEEFPID